MTITSEAARAVVGEVRSTAAGRGAVVSVAVVDRSGVLVAFERMDGAPSFSAELAVAKAQSSASFGRSTVELEAAVADRPAFAASFVAHTGAYVGRGGAPVVVDGQVVGAIGVSGDSAEHEDELARQAAAAVSSTRR